MAVYDFHVIYLGKVGIEDWDTDSSPSNPNVLENMESFIGYDSSAAFGDSLWRQRETAQVDSNIDDRDNHVYEDSTYPRDGYYVSSDGTMLVPFDDSATVTWSGGEDQYIDSFAAFEMKVTFDDDLENPVTGTARFMQTIGGDTFLLSYDYNSQDEFGYDFDITSRPIASIEIMDVPKNSDGEVFENIGDVRGTEYNRTSFAACFASGTLIVTREGERAVETLAVGDLVHTRDCGLQRIRWIGSRLFTAKDLRSSPNLRPIRIRKGSLGKDIPSRDLVVSPQHRILLRNRVAKRMFGGAEVLVAAKHLMEIDGVSLAGDMEEVEYFHIMFDRHQLVYSNGAETESMYAGKMAMKAVPREQAEEIYAIFPGLRDVTMKDFPAPARLLVPERRARQLAARIRKNEHAGGLEPSILPEVQDRRG